MQSSGDDIYDYSTMSGEHYLHLAFDGITSSSNLIQSAVMNEEISFVSATNLANQPFIMCVLNMVYTDI